MADLFSFVPGAVERAKYESKIRFINEHFKMDDPFEKKTVLDDDLLRAVGWGAERSDEQVMRPCVPVSWSILLCCSLLLSGNGGLGKHHVRHRAGG